MNQRNKYFFKLSHKKIINPQLLGRILKDAELFYIKKYLFGYFELLKKLSPPQVPIFPSIIVHQYELYKSE